jgi:hypothetical protein
VKDQNLLALGHRFLYYRKPLRFGTLFGLKRIPETEEELSWFILDNEVREELIEAGRKHIKLNDQVLEDK